MVRILNLGLIVSHSYKDNQWVIYQFDIAPFTLKESEYLNPRFMDKFMDILMDWLFETLIDMDFHYTQILTKDRWHWGIQIFNWYYTPVYNYKPNHQPRLLFRIIETARDRIYVNDLIKVDFSYIFEGK